MAEARPPPGEDDEDGRRGAPPYEPPTLVHLGTLASLTAAISLPLEPP